MLAAPAFARNPWAEPLLATLAFALWVNLFELVEHKGDYRAAWRSIISDRESPVLSAAVAYLLGILVFRAVAPPAEVDFGAPTAPRFCAEVAYGVLVYDIVFYALHRAMHVLRLAAHAHHHRSGPRVKAHHTLDHSLVDGALQVLANILAQRWGPFGAKSWLARLLHNVVVTYLLTDSHADTPYRLCDRFPGILKGAAKHRDHHAHAGPPYQQFFGFMDDLFSPAPPEKVVPASG